MANFKDYDALTEQKEEFVRNIGGRRIEFKKTLPARVVLDLRREALKTGDDDDEAGVQFLLDMGEKAMGSEVFEHCMNHMGLREILELCADLLRYYGISDEEEEEGKAEERESPSTTSSESGEPSILTSSAFGLIPGGLSTEVSSPGPASSTG